MVSFRTNGCAMCQLPAGECQQTPSAEFCAYRPHCKKGRSSKQGHHGLCLLSGQQMQTWEPIIVDLPSSLENFQKYLAFKLNQDIYDEAMDIFTRCFVSLMQENLEEKLMMLTHIRMQAYGCLAFNSCNSLLLLLLCVA